MLPLCWGAVRNRGLRGQSFGFRAQRSHRIKGCVARALNADASRNSAHAGRREGLDLDGSRLRVIHSFLAFSPPFPADQPELERTLALCLCGMLDNRQLLAHAGAEFS